MLMHTQLKPNAPGALPRVRFVYSGVGAHRVCGVGVGISYGGAALAMAHWAMGRAAAAGPGPAPRGRSLPYPRPGAGFFAHIHRARGDFRRGTRPLILRGLISYLGLSWRLEVTRTALVLDAECRCWVS